MKFFVVGINIRVWGVGIIFFIVIVGNIVFINIWKLEEFECKIGMVIKW